LDVLIFLKNTEQTHIYQPSSTHGFLEDSGYAIAMPVLPAKSTVTQACGKTSEW